MTVDLRSPVNPTDPAQFTAAERVDDGTNCSLLAGFIASFNHAYANVGVFTISYTATDKDGGLSTAVTKTTTVGGVQVITDPSNPTKTALVVGGTDGNDNIVVDKGTGSSALKVTINGVVQGTFSFSGSVFVFGQAGNDTITIVKQVDRNAFVYSGIGNDNISSGNGRTVMIGGDDNDTLTGGNGVDVLIGGIGADSLNGGNGDDLLIAGNTLHDDFNVANATALRQLRDEWSANTYATRIKRLLGQTPGSAFVFRTSGVNQNVFSDTSVDRLAGANDSDWFLGNVAGTGTLDITDRSSAETATDN